MKRFTVLSALISLGIASMAAADHRVLLCHKGHEITIDEHAVPAHLAHGDSLGPCSGGGPDTDGDSVADAVDNCPGVANPSQADFDADGFGAACDCRDTDPTMHPGGTEVCDGLDNDCDGVLPPAEADNDGDTFSTCQGDCDDTNPTVHPGATEVINGVDDDCDGLADCSDPSVTTSPETGSVCSDGIDNDCDALVDCSDSSCAGSPGCP